jgi:hypothetical protein
MTNIRHFWVASNSRFPMQTIKTMWKAIFQNKLTTYKANLPSFVKTIIKSGCYVDLSRRLRLKCHPKMAAWERLINVVPEQNGKVEYERERLLGIAKKLMNFHSDSQQPFALVFDVSALLVDNLNWNSCIHKHVTCNMLLSGQNFSKGLEISLRW